MQVSSENFSFDNTLQEWEFDDWSPAPVKLQHTNSRLQNVSLDLPR